MSIEQINACVLRCVAHRRVRSLFYGCQWKVPFAKGEPETGQCLDAQSWEDGKSLVLIGTEDFEALNCRLPNGGLSGAAWPPFPDHGLRITIPVVQPGQEVSLHFIVASNSLPEPRECSCWYAVDIDHDRVLACL